MLYFINYILKIFIFQSLALLEKDVDIKLAVLSVLQHFSKGSGKLYSSSKYQSYVCILNINRMSAYKLSVLSLKFCVSAKNCDQMLRASAGTTVCSRLMDPDPTGQLLFRSVEILWNMLEYGDQGQLAHQLNNLTCIRYNYLNCLNSLSTSRFN